MTVEANAFFVGKLDRGHLHPRMKMPCRADFHLQKPSIAKTANRLFGRTVHDLPPRILRCGWTRIPEELFIGRLKSFAPPDGIALNHNNQNGVAFAGWKALFTGNQLWT